jgi:hypothetical protein
MLRPCTPPAAATASSGVDPPLSQLRCFPPLSHLAVARRRTRLSHKDATVLAQRSRRPPPLAAGAPPRRPSPGPNQALESTPRDPRVVPRPRLAGPGRRFAEIWPDRRRPASRDPIASPQVSAGSKPRTKGRFVRNQKFHGPARKLLLKQCYRFC